VQLSDRDRDVLAFEREWWRYADGKDAAARDRFGLEPEAYYRALNAVIDQPAALEHDPLLVRRLRRMRRSRQLARSARRTGGRS